MDFEVYITNEALTYARIASTTSGWYLKPKKWAISDQVGEVSRSRTTDSMNTPWVTNPFSGVYNLGNNKIQHNIVIPPDLVIASASRRQIAEIYFIYEDFYGNEFLFAVGRPLEELYYTYGISQTYCFVFTLTNSGDGQEDVFLINYSYPQDIEDHNANQNAHPNLLAKDGSRLATGKLQYNQYFTFNNDNELITKYYVDNNISSLRTYTNNEFNSLVSSINSAALDNCPVGAMVWWPGPATKIPSNWAIRAGQILSRTTFDELFRVIGTLYGSTASTNFKLPNDLPGGETVTANGITYSSTQGGLFISSTDSLPQITTGSINQNPIKPPKLPNIRGESWGWYGNYETSTSDQVWGAFRINHAAKKIGINNDACDGKNDPGIDFSASFNNPIYTNSYNEVTPVHRSYIPIIKVTTCKVAYTWTANTEYVLGDIIKTNRGKYYKLTAFTNSEYSGKSGNTEPKWYINGDLNIVYDNVLIWSKLSYDRSTTYHTHTTAPSS